MGIVKRIAPTVVVATALLCLAMIFGCESPNAKSVSAMSSPGVDGTAEIEELPAQGEFTPSNFDTRVRVNVQVPKGYERSDGMEDIGSYSGKSIELETVTVDLGKTGSLRITIDDVGFFDWWYGSSVYGTTTLAEYVESAKDDPSNSSWPISIGGHDGVALVTGAVDRGGEQSGDAFVFLDGATVAFSAVLPDDGTPTADAYSAFFRSKEVADLLGGLSISLE